MFTSGGYQYHHTGELGEKIRIGYQPRGLFTTDEISQNHAMKRMKDLEVSNVFVEKD